MKEIFCNFNITIKVKPHSVLCSGYIFLHLYHDTEFLHVNFIIHEPGIKLCYSWITNE